MCKKSTTTAPQTKHRCRHSCRLMDAHFLTYKHTGFKRLALVPVDHLWRSQPVKHLLHVFTMVLVSTGLAGCTSLGAILYICEDIVVSSLCATWTSTHPVSEWCLYSLHPQQPAPDWMVAFPNVPQRVSGCDPSPSRLSFLSAAQLNMIHMHAAV